MLQLLKSAPQRVIPNYDLPPFVNRDHWTMLIDRIKTREQNSPVVVDSTKWYTLRCDIRGMSRIKRRFEIDGTFTPGYNKKFADWMCETTLHVATKFRAQWAYTQSDEFTLVIGPSGSERFTHAFGGRRDKLITTCAAEASVALNTTSKTAHVMTFDCRLAEWDNEQDAQELILWRAYDCGSNGISDAVHVFKDHKLSASSCRDKLIELEARGALPLASHQAYGSLYKLQNRKYIHMNSDMNILNLGF